jgi:hypothetical protein
MGVPVHQVGEHLPGAKAEDVEAMLNEWGARLGGGRDNLRIDRVDAAGETTAEPAHPARALNARLLLKSIQYHRLGYLFEITWLPS